MGNAVGVGAYGTTYHLTPESVWESQADVPSYRPEAFEREGFIHCTDGLENVLAAGNRYYTSDTRPYVVLIIATDRITAPITYDDPERIFPHIHGTLNRDAVTAVKPILRDSDGTFTGIGE